MIDDSIFSKQLCTIVSPSYCAVLIRKPRMQRRICSCQHFIKLFK